VIGGQGPVRVGFLTESDAWGGAEVTLARLLTNLDEDIDAIVIGTSAPALERLADCRPGTRILHLKERPGRLEVFSRLADRAALAALELDVLHANLTSLVSCRGRLALARTVPGLPIVAAHHLPVWPTGSFWHQPGRQVQRQLLRAGVAVHVGVGHKVSRTVEQEVGLPFGAVRTIHNGVPDHGPRRLGTMSGSPLIGTICRLEPQKGLDVLLEAATRLESARFLIVGSGSERGRLERRILELGLGHRVEIRPWTDAPDRVLKELDVFVLPSFDEGLPLAVLEAMMAGVPVVASAVGSVGEAVVDGITGALVPAGDPVALGAALDRLCTYRGLGVRLGQAGRHRALERFSVPAMTASYQALYESLAQRPARQPAAGAQLRGAAVQHRLRRHLNSMAKSLEQGARSDSLRRWLPGPVRVMARATPLGRRPDFLTGSVLRGSMNTLDVVRVVKALESSRLEFCLAGGWGVDALLGARTRRHDDVDVILADYSRDLSAAVEALAALGLRPSERGTLAEGTAGAWMPELVLLDDGAGHRVELLAMDRDLVTAAAGVPPEALLAVGMVGRRPVPCLSVRAQIVMHGGYENRPTDPIDVEKLLGRFGPSPATHEHRSGDSVATPEILAG